MKRREVGEERGRKNSQKRVFRKLGSCKLLIPWKCIILDGLHWSHRWDYIQRIRNRIYLSIEEYTYSLTVGYYHILTNTPPQWKRSLSNAETGAKISEQLWREALGKYAYWRCVGTWRTRTCPIETLSRTKCRSISICFVLWCWTGLDERYTAEILSQ